MANQKFNRRIYKNPKHFIFDFNYMLTHRPLIRKAMREQISFQFRERLMMVVTEVNGCRYCSYFHANQSLKSGISQDEIKELLAGSIPIDTPAEEYTALIYAQHWAENNGNPDSEARQKLILTYGEEKAAAIEIVLRMINMGNLSGNTFDYFLFRITGGLDCGKMNIVINRYKN